MSGEGRIKGDLSQFFPPKPEFTETQLPDLTGKVYVVTGSNTGIGKELATLLYAKNAKIYIAARSREKALDAIDSIKSIYPSSQGQLVFLPLDLADLSTIRNSANEFLAQEKKLHVLFNNAGVMTPPRGSTTAQGYDLELGVNNLGPYLLTKLLTPLLEQTAKTEPIGTVRVVWTSSSAAESISPKPGGIPINELPNYTAWCQDQAPMSRYAASKVGNYFHAVEYAKRHNASNIVSVSLNPGMLASDLWREKGRLLMFFLRTFLLHPPVYGAYTTLFAGLSPQVGMEQTASWIVPWGRFMRIRKDLKDAVENGAAAKFYDWTDMQVEPYLS